MQMNDASRAAKHRCYAWLREHHVEMVERRRKREEAEREGDKQAAERDGKAA